MVAEIWSVKDRIFCHNRPFFALLLPYGPKNQIFEKMKKTLEDLIILQMLIINDSHMIYYILDMGCNRNFFIIIILDHFSLLLRNNP